MVDRISMSMSGDSFSDETLNQGPLMLLLRQQYKFPFGVDIVQFYFFFQPSNSINCLLNVPGEDATDRDHL